MRKESGVNHYYYGANDNKQNTLNPYKNANGIIFGYTQTSNVREKFKNESGLKKDSYFRKISDDAHQRELKLFSGIREKIKEGIELSAEELEVAQNGKFYRKVSIISHKKVAANGVEVPGIFRKQNLRNQHVNHAGGLFQFGRGLLSVTVC